MHIPCFFNVDLKWFGALQFKLDVRYYSKQSNTINSRQISWRSTTAITAARLYLSVFYTTRVCTVHVLIYTQCK